MPDTIERSSTDPVVLAQIGALFADYWYDVDHHWGRGASGLYTRDGEFTIGKDRMENPEAIAAFYAWRATRGAREARHVVSNLRVRELGIDEVEVDAIMCLYAADGVPVLLSQPPILIADVTARCVREGGVWLFASHVLTPVFAGGTPITAPSEARK